MTAARMTRAITGPLRRAALLGGGVLLAGCAAGLDASPPLPISGSGWAIERQVARCRATQSGGTRAGMAGGGGVFLFGGVTAVSRNDSPNGCGPILALTDEDVGEIRTLTQAIGAGARGLETNWQSRAGARREIVLSVYPAAASAGRPCRMVSATLTVFGDAAGALLGAPPVTALDEQRVCRTQSGAWEPG
jgi:hypothetical protein